MRRRVIFNGCALPLLLVAPQRAVTAVFFLWPAGVAVYQSVLQQDAWGLRTEFVGLRTFAEALADPSWRAAAWNTAVFSAAVAGLAMGVALVLAVQADKSIRGARAYRTLLIWPYAVAPAVAAVLWLFLFHPSIGLIGRAPNANGIPRDTRVNGGARGGGGGVFAVAAPPRYRVARAGAERERRPVAPRAQRRAGDGAGGAGGGVEAG